MHRGMTSNKVRPRALGGAALLLVVGTLAACTSATQKPPVAETQAPTYVSDYVAPAATGIAPLTGVSVPAGSLTAPSIAAKVDNHWDARPQVGLSSTDLVFEELVEGGLSRYVAVWQSKVPAEIGPVRSIRPMDPDIISPLGGIVAYSGGQQRFVSLMQSTNVYNAIHGQSDTASTFFRTPSKQAPHNVLVKAPEVIAQHADLPAPPQLFSFADTAASASATRDGAPTPGIALVIGGSAMPSWNWDAAAGVYRRSMTGGAPDMDDLGGQLSAINVIILRVPVSSGLGVPKTELIGGGEAWIAGGGNRVHATWSKGSRTDPIRLVDDTGTVIRLAPGNSWIELVPNSGSVTFAAG